MKFLDEFRNGEHARIILGNMARLADGKKLKFMEFCGGHTICLLKYGIPDLLPEGIEMVTGPGCPVCVTSYTEIDNAIELAQNPNIIMTSFGDMIRVPGSEISLADAKALGADIRIVYSPNDAVHIAKVNPDKKVVFFAVGFETTVPVTAVAMKIAERENVNNFYILSAHKTIPAILGALLAGEVHLDGFICPGHVTAITGISMYDILIKAGKPCVVTGFEPLDMLQAIYQLVKQIAEGRADIEIEYTRAVKPEGNTHALKLMGELFEPVDAYWRGIGLVPGSGLRPKGAFARFDAMSEFGIKPVTGEKEKTGCICGQILRGGKKPTDCPLFRKTCTPETPVGACMVSDEGSCSVYYRFGRSSFRIK